MTTEERTAQALGYFSIALGVPLLTAPGTVARVIGLRPGGIASLALRLVGLREITAGVGILGQRRPAQWLWARAAGDVMDLALTAATLASGSNRRGRIAATLVALAGITALDAQTAEQLTPLSDQGLVKGITVNRPGEDVQRFWQTFAQRPGVAEDLRSARFSPAPGGRGTEIRVQVPATSVRASVLRLRGRHPQQQVDRDFRRAKQLMETGQASMSAATAHGAGLFQEPGQPLGEHAEVRA